MTREFRDNFCQARVLGFERRDLLGPLPKHDVLAAQLDLFLMLNTDRCDDAGDGQCDDHCDSRFLHSIGYLYHAVDAACREVNT